MKIAQVGYGYWGRNLLRVLVSSKESEKVICCETDEKARKELRKNWPDVEIQDDFETILKRDDIDAVILATPAGMHYKQAKKVLEAKKHAFVEKPLALASCEARELVQLAEKNNLILMVGHTFLYNDAVRYVKEKIDNGDLGEIYYIYFQRLNLGRVRQDVDALWNLAPHDISIAQYWFGEKPEKISAHGVSYLQKGIDDASFININYPSGRFANIHVSWLSPFKMRQAVVIGSKKMLFYDDTSNDQKIVIYDKGIDRKDIEGSGSALPFKDFAQFNLVKRAGDILIPKINFREPLKVEIQEFIECIKTGNTPVSDGKMGLEVIEILETAAKSAKMI
jgi:predicted dehydrogenase